MFQHGGVDNFKFVGNRNFEFYGEVNDMEKWGMFEFNTPYVGEIIEKINDVVLPNDYIEFMKKHNGGGELYGIDNKGNYFNVPVLIDEDDVAVLGTEIELLPDKINALWE